MNDRSEAAGLALEFVELNKYLSEGGERAAALHRLVGIAVAVVPGCRWAAITAWRERQRPRSLAFSEDVAMVVDQLQYDIGDGPCLSAALVEEPVRIPDLDADGRWPRFRQAALSGSPVRGVLSFHLADGPDRTALNLYSDRPGALDDESFTLASLFAAHARVLLLHADSTEKAANLSGALTTSRQIGAAIGILMNIHRITAEQAFELLRTTSQQLNRKLHTVAEDVTTTGLLPRKKD
jgi:hypothetical protein